VTLDEHLETAIRFATRNRIEAFLRLFETHRRHEGLQIRDNPVPVGTMVFVPMMAGG
jgi:hypothetical protein